MHAANSLSKGQTIFLGEGHRTFADIIFCLPPVPNNWGKGSKTQDFSVACVIYHPAVRNVSSYQEIEKGKKENKEGQMSQR